MSEEKRDNLVDALRMMAEAYRRLPTEVKQRHRERLSYSVNDGRYPAKLHTPDGGVFQVGPAYVWGHRFDGKQNVDLFIHKVPEHLHDSGLGECKLAIFSDEGVPLLSGKLKDDGNRQDGLNSICVAIVPEGDHGSS